MKTNEAVSIFLFPALPVLLFGFLTLNGSLETLDYRSRDLMMYAKPEPKIDERFVMVDIDDPSILYKGLWPWPRYILADILMQLKEYGTETATFDIEYIDPGVSGVSAREKDERVKELQSEFSDLFAAVKNGIISLDDAISYTPEVLEDGVRKIVRDNDAYLGHSIGLFGKAFVTLNVKIEVGDNPEAKAAESFGQENFALGSVTDVSGDFSGLPEIPEGSLRVTIEPIARFARGAGFTNVDPDLDGVTRRVYLLYRQGDKVFAQLAFRPLIEELGNPPLEVYQDKIILKLSRLDPPNKDIVVPLDEKGRFIINWTKKDYQNTFKHMPVSRLLAIQDFYQVAGDKVKELGDAGFLQFYEGGNFSGLVEDYRNAYSAALESGDQKSFEEYLTKKREFRDHFAALVNGDTEKNILDYFQGLLENETQNQPELQADIALRKSDITTIFARLREEFRGFESNEALAKSALPNGFAIIGNTATSTTDLGLTPFVDKYENPGVHAAVANTIFIRGFQDELPPWISLAYGTLIAFGVAFLVWRLKTFSAVILGFASIAVLIVGGTIFFVLTGLYPGLMMPLLSTTVCVIGLTVYKFINTEQEKRFIRGAWAAYLSPDVIKEIEADPSKLNLGGEKRNITAMFTDVKGFSTFSEKLDPNDLVTLLNEYLTGMGNIILDFAGMIDKYEGDAIIAFWGAPTLQPDHAKRALVSAIKMKQTEAEMNERFIRDGLAPTPLLTRIGINTGDMTVGNMGTRNRMNYTAMGNAMNLAARLEGVNKQYGTWILTSQFTRDTVDDEIVFRRLDRVTVVGIKTPVRLYEVVGEKTAVDRQKTDIIGLFDAGIDHFEAQRWDKAISCFNDILKLDPEDGPAKTFLARSLDYKKNPPGEDWDGVYNVTSK